MGCVYVRNDSFHESITDSTEDPCIRTDKSNSGDRIDLMLVNRLFSDINPISCGEHHCFPGHTFGPTMRFYYLIHFIVSGQGWFETETQKYELSKGHIFIIRPQKIYVYGADLLNPWHYRWIGFTSSRDLSRIFDQETFYLPESNYLFRMMIDAERFAGGKEYYLCAKIYELLSILIKKSAAADDPYHNYVEIAKNYMEINYNNPHLSVAQIAENLSLDRSYFSTIFKKNTGKPPQTYLADLRLNKAAEMLTMNILKTNEVGHACGYNDPYHFSKAFKKKFGVSPSFYSKLSLYSQDE